MCMIQIKSKVWSLEDFNDEAPVADHFKQKEIKKKKKKLLTVSNMATVQSRNNWKFPIVSWEPRPQCCDKAE